MSAVQIFEKKLFCQYWCKKARKHMCLTDRHDMTLAVKVALNQFVFLQEEIQEEYMQQELKREWNEFKHGVLLDVINSRGIRPGYGKWSK